MSVELEGGNDVMKHVGYLIVGGQSQSWPTEKKKEAMHA
jgi:hypothetical protein